MITWNISNLYYGINYLSKKFKRLQKKLEGLSLSMIINIFLLAQFILTRGVLFILFLMKKKTQLLLIEKKKAREDS